MLKEIFLENSRKEKLSGVLFVPQKYKRGIIISHGFGGNKDGFLGIGERLSKEDYLVLVYDFSGHGYSEGDFKKTSIPGLLDDLECAIKFMEGYTKNILLIGHSIGGAMSLYVPSKNKNIKGVCTLAAPFFKKIKKIPKKEELDHCDDLTKAYWNLIGSAQEYQEEYHTSLKKIKIPILIMHGDQDLVVSLDNSKEIFNLSKSKKRLIILKGTDHTLFGKDKEIIESIIEFFK